MADKAIQSDGTSKMQLAGKYNNYRPEIFPDQKTMHFVAQQTNNSELKQALLNFQYPFTMNELKNSGYSPQVINKVLNIATNGRQGNSI